MNPIWVTVISVITFLYFLHVLMNLIQKKNRLPPGPKGLPILGHLHLLGKNPHQQLSRLSLKYGPIMYLRLGSLPTIVVSSPEAAELFLKTHDLNFANKPYLRAWKYITYDQRNLIFGPYGPYLRNMRKLCTQELLTNHKMNKFQPTRTEEIGLLMSSLKQAAELRETVDLSVRVMSLNTDIICQMVFGRKYCGEDLDGEGFKAVMSKLHELIGIFDLADYFPYLGMIDLQGVDRLGMDLMKVFDELLERIIDDHVDNNIEGKERLDFVDTMMAIFQSGEAGFEFDRRHVKAVLLDMLVAGVDTAATTVEWILSELIRNPMVMEKLQKELELVVGMDRMVEESHLDSLEYLNFVVKETFRLHPVVPLIIHESVEDCIVIGFNIPKKSRIIVNVWVIGRSPNVWSYPEKFSPERFLGSKVDLLGRDFNLIPFGSGRRGCPGLNLGLIMVRLVVAQLVHCFDWELPNDFPPGDLDMTEQFSVVTARVEHLLAIPSYRLHSELKTFSSN